MRVKTKSGIKELVQDVAKVLNKSTEQMSEIVMPPSAIKVYSDEDSERQVDVPSDFLNERPKRLAVKNNSITDSTFSIDFTRKVESKSRHKVN
jgi:hypothetical protein